MIDLPLKKYKELESLLEKEFNKVSASVQEKEEQLSAEKNYYLWQVKGKRKQRLSILFASQKEEIKAELPPRKARNKVAIIIDDMLCFIFLLSPSTAIEETALRESSSPE